MWSHEQEVDPTTSLDNNCIELEFQTDLSYYFDLRQTYLASKLKFVKGHGYEAYNTKKVEKERKEEAKANEETKEDEEAAVPLVTHVNNILNSVSSNIEVYTSNQQTYNSNGLYAHKSYISRNFEGATSEYKRVLHCKVYDAEEYLDEILKAPLFEPSFTKKMKSPVDATASFCMVHWVLAFPPLLICCNQIGIVGCDQ